MSFFGSRVAIKDGANLDAFGRLRASNPSTLFAAACQYDAEPLLLETGATGTGAAGVHSSSNRMVELSAAAGTGTSYIQAYEYAAHQPGRSLLAFVSGVLGPGLAGAVVDAGLFDTANGVFLRQNGASGLQLVRRTSASGVVVNTVVAQADWNIDEFTGSGRSGFTLDATKAFILVIDAQQMGRVRVGFNVHGEILYAHEFLTANETSLPVMQTLTLPVQMLITATSTAAGKSAWFQGATVLSEGGSSDGCGYSFATPEMTVTAASGTATHLLSLRPATTFNGITNRASIRLDSIDLQVTGGTVPIFWQLALGSTFSAGPTYAAVNSTYSASQYSSAVGTLSGSGLVIASGYVAYTGAVRYAVSEEIRTRYPITLDRAGAVRANGTLNLLVTGIGGTAATRAAFNFTEIR